MSPNDPRNTEGPYLMLDLTTPTDHADPYFWLVVLLAHVAIGAAIIAVLVALIKSVETSLLILLAGYFGGWEGGVQGFGAGGVDALVDTFAVMAGAGFALSLWFRRARLSAIVAAIIGVVAIFGIKRKSK